MHGREGKRLRRHGRRQAVEAVLEDGVDVAVGADADEQGPRTGGLEAGGAVAATEAKQPQAGAVALFGMRTVGEDGGDEGAVWGPMVSAHWMRREGVHSRCC